MKAIDPFILARAPQLEHLVSTAGCFSRLDRLLHVIEALCSPCRHIPGSFMPL